MDRKAFVKSILSLAALGGVNIYANENLKNGGSSVKKTLIVYFSWSGNTRGIANKIKNIIGGDISELELEKPYSQNYNTCLDEALNDQKRQARPKLKNRFDNIGEYGTILLGYPNWWASIPMPIATFLESHKFDGKNIIPFCSHGGGRLGQSVSAISKICPKSNIGIPFSAHYSGGSSVDKDLKKWLNDNKII